MKILYDHQTFSIQKYGGISRYFFELMNLYETHKEEYNIDCELALRYSNNAYLRNSNLFNNIMRAASTEDFCFGLDFRGKAKIHRALTKIGLAHHPTVLNQRISIKTLEEGRFDLFHPTYYDPYFYKYLEEKPFVLTIHDMIHELYSGMYFHKFDRTAEIKRYLALRADRIIAVSKKTKDDIIKFYNINEEKIQVIHHGSSMSCDQKYNSDFPFKYILFIGDRHVYKNFNLFIRSIATLLRNDNELYLVCGGSIPFNKIENNLIKELNIENRVIHKPIINDNTLTRLYQNAICFVFPSLYEGFGIPILEAFSCKCPVVASNTSSLPEVGGDAAVYFNPEDPVSIRDAVKNIIYDENYADVLRKKGFDRLKNFSWNKCAMETKMVYEEVLGK